MMNLTTETGSPTPVTIHAVELPPEASIPVLDAAEVSGFGFRQYPDVEYLLDSASPSSQGCILIAGSGDGSSLAAVRRLQSHFHTIPIIVLLDSNSADSAVELMRLGVFFVLTKPLEHQKIVSTIASAVETSIASQATIDLSRDASVRMKEATPKELEVLGLIMDGKKNKEIAGILGITVRAVEDRRFRLMKKVAVDSVAELVTLAVSAQYFQQGFPSGSLRTAPVSDVEQCVKGLEVWVPAADGSHLELSQSFYPDAAVFDEATQGMTFRRGEGLPGRVWERRAPAFLKEIATSDFVRTTAAGAAGVTAGVGFPVFADGDVKAVVLILLDSRHQITAAFEAWRIDPQSDALRLVNGTYINCERLGRLSEFVHLPIGTGLAGLVAEQARPLIRARFADDARAVRGLALAAERLVSGVGLPLTDSGSVNCDVFIVFSAETSPVFSTMQIWKANGLGITLSSEYVDGVPSLTAQMSKVRSVTSSIAFECWNRGVPVVAGNSTADRIAHSPTTPPPRYGIAIPTVVNGKVLAVTVLAN